MRGLRQSRYYNAYIYISILVVEKRKILVMPLVGDKLFSQSTDHLNMAISLTQFYIITAEG